MTIDWTPFFVWWWAVCVGMSMLSASTLIPRFLEWLSTQDANAQKIVVPLIVAVFLAGGALLSFLVQRSYDWWATDPPYRVTVQIAIVHPDGTCNSSHFSVVPRTTRPQRRPVNSVLWTTIANRQSESVLIDTVVIEAQHQSGGWVELPTVRTLFADVYLHVVTPQRGFIGLKLEMPLLDQILNEAPIDARREASGWVLVQYPVGFALNDSTRFRIRLTDVPGTEYVSDPLIVGTREDAGSVRDLPQFVRTNEGRYLLEVPISLDWPEECR